MTKLNKITKKDIDLVRFPGGEFKLILKTKIDNSTLVEWNYHEVFANGEKTLSPSEELVALIQLNRIFSEYVVNWNEQKHIVMVDHFPFQRQDKAQILGEVAFDGFDFDRLIIDQHAAHSSDKWNIRVVSEIMAHIPDKTLIIFPDRSAEKRLRIWENKYSVTFTKSRNKDDGSLTFDKTPDDLKVQLSEPVLFGQVYIVDDIVGYGGTFKHVAKEIRKINKDIPITLLVNHSDGVLSKKDLKEAGINEIIILDEIGVK